MFKQSIFVLASLLGTSVFAQDNNMYDITYSDEANKGAFSQSVFITEDGRKTTVGEYRQELIGLVTRAVSLQFNHVVKHEISVNFGVPEGYAALTLGPSFTELTEFDTLDEFGFMEVGRSYPSTIMSALLQKRPAGNDSEDAIVSFADSIGDLQTREGDEYPPIVYSAYHELQHVNGFVPTDCLGGCIPEPVSRNGHMSPFLYYNDNGDVKEFESLTIDKKTEAYLSTDKFWYGGSQASKNAAMNELTSGQEEGYVYIYATPNPETGDVDGQAGGHFSFDVQPAQLMHSARAKTKDLGMAAYLLCDVGWCQQGGKVIEQSVEAVLNENASSDTEAVIDIFVSENLNVGVNEFELNIRPNPSMNIIALEDPDNMCIVNSNGYSCKSALAPLSKMSVRLIVTPSDSYELTGELRSTGYDVDRNGFNNILDTTLSVTPVVVEPPSSQTPAPTPTTPSTPTSNSGGGGSMSLLLIPLVLLAMFRRRMDRLIIINN